MSPAMEPNLPTKSTDKPEIKDGTNAPSSSPPPVLPSLCQRCGYPVAGEQCGQCGHRQCPGCGDI